MFQVFLRRVSPFQFCYWVLIREVNRNYKGRTDSMMVLTINPKTNKTTIMSIPRDTLIAIDGYENTFHKKSTRLIHMVQQLQRLRLFRSG